MNDQWIDLNWLLMHMSCAVKKKGEKKVVVWKERRSMSLSGAIYAVSWLQQHLTKTLQSLLLSVTSACCRDTANGNRMDGDFHSGLWEPVSQAMVRACDLVYLVSYRSEHSTAWLIRKVACSECYSKEHLISRSTVKYRNDRSAVTHAPQC